MNRINSFSPLVNATQTEAVAVFFFVCMLTYKKLSVPIHLNNFVITVM